MAQIIESIPNISEGRRQDVIGACADAVRGVPGCTVLDVQSDASHNRSVITYIGDAKAVEDATIALAAKAAELIDLNHHTGEHPRVGATDVIPFVPIRDCSMEDCVELSKRVGRRMADELHIPVFLYEESASRPERRNLADVRKGGFEGMAEKVMKDEWEPDFGGRTVHRTAGVSVVGARKPLVAFNWDLDTDDVRIAKNIAHVIREKDGGLKDVKALGLLIEDKETGRKFAQVSCNMCDCNVTPLYRVTEMIKSEAARYGVRVTNTELVGLTPAKFLINAAEYYLQLKDFDDSQVLESHLL
ncbi:MAG: glutamate formimidoyltransferase [Eubacteriales bacterium]|nr:glutamate formimidoyltransferase [Eubacteriales bacterium]